MEPKPVPPERQASRRRMLRQGLTALVAAAGFATSLAAAGLSTFRAQGWDQDLLLLPDEAESGDGFGSALAVGDFDGDGYQDLAIGVPDEHLPSASGEVLNAGAVLLLYGSASGLDLARAQAWSQDAPGVLDQAEIDDFFGQELAAGDFNADAFDDLAITALRETLDAHIEGAVHVLYGSALGLSATGDQLWSQSDPAVAGESSSASSFGASLATGDFDGDGFVDLAIGVPVDLEPGSEILGGVNVLFGSAMGLTADGDQHFLAADLGGMEDYTLFGLALAAGDFDADGFTDLAVGAPDDDFVGQSSVGSVRVLFGSGLGLTTDRDLYLLGPQALGEQGKALAACDFDGDGDDDLAIGIPGRDVGASGDAAGSVVLRLGHDGGLLDGGEWHQDTPGIQGVAEANDRFGGALTCGDFDADGRPDLAIGAPSEDVPNDEPDSGALHVLLGAPTGLTAAGNQLWYRSLLPIADASPDDAQERFAGALAAGDFDGNGHADLAIGAPGEWTPFADHAGAVFVLHGFLFADGFESGGLGAWSTHLP